MIILDTDHITTLKYSQSAEFERLTRRMADSVDQDFATTVITVEEQMRGWLAQIKRFREPNRQVPAYAELAGLIEFFSYWTLLPFDTAAADQFTGFRQQRIRTATMDLKIASIAVTTDCLLLTANTQDFTAIPSLRLEDWIH